MLENKITPVKLIHSCQKSKIELLQKLGRKIYYILLHIFGMILKAIRNSWMVMNIWTCKVLKFAYFSSLGIQTLRVLGPLQKLLLVPIDVLKYKH